MSSERRVPHEFEGEKLESVFVGRRDGEARPTVILIPTVMGVSDLELGFAKQLVELGYNAFVADLFGKKFRGAARDVMFGETPSSFRVISSTCCSRRRSAARSLLSRVISANIVSRGAPWNSLPKRSATIAL